ncbi:hypothetical protein BJX64DRAFT_91031 [Aspergillus heterothallicus]
MNQGRDIRHLELRSGCRVAQRRPHKKSRTGCRNCKGRKVKCDENKPSCLNCARCSMRCDFVPSDSDTSINPASTPTCKNNPRKRGRPLKDWNAILKKSKSTSAEPPIELASAQSEATLTHERALPASFPLNVDDMQLFYHFITDSALTFGHDVLWRDKVPLLAFECPYVLRLMLAISAVHMARKSAISCARMARLQRLAEAHFSIALREITNLLPCIDSTNCSALYIATVLVCNYTFAKPPEPGHLLVIADNNEVAWWNLFRGMRFVVQRTGLEVIFSGHLGPYPSENPTPLPPPYRQSGYIPWEDALSDLRRMIRDCKSDRTEAETLEILRRQLADCFREVYGTRESPEESTHGKTDVVIRWLWILEDDFITQVKDNKPAALILLSYFVVLLQTLECFWFMRGWADHVLKGVEERLDSVYSPWTFWPRHQLGWQPSSS